jgi:hypothetical protein
MGQNRPLHYSNTFDLWNVRATLVYAVYDKVMWLNVLILIQSYRHSTFHDLVFMYVDVRMSDIWFDWCLAIFLYPILFHQIYA